MRLQFTASTEVELICQNCLAGYVTQLNCRYVGRVAETREAFEAMEQDEDAVLSDGNELCITELIEDELILALPMVPRHAEDVCPSVVAAEVDGSQAEAETYRPFAGLNEAFESKGSKAQTNR